MTAAAHVYSDMPDRHRVLRRPWWAPERSARDPEDEVSDLLYDVADGQPWMREAACVTARNPDAWFPERGHPSNDTRYALRVCKHHCPVALACLAYALEHHPLKGIWGGTTHDERHHHLREKAL